MSGFLPLITTISPSRTVSGASVSEFCKFRELSGEFRVVPAPEGEGRSRPSQSPAHRPT